MDKRLAMGHLLTCTTAHSTNPRGSMVQVTQSLAPDTCLSLVQVCQPHSRPSTERKLRDPSHRNTLEGVSNRASSARL